MHNLSLTHVYKCTSERDILYDLYLLKHATSPHVILNLVFKLNKRFNVKSLLVKIDFFYADISLIRLPCDVNIKQLGSAGGKWASKRQGLMGQTASHYQHL